MDSVLTIREAADWIRCKPRHIHDLLAAGLILGVKLISPKSGRINPQSRCRVYRASVASYLGLAEVKPTFRRTAEYWRQERFATAILGLEPHGGPERLSPEHIPEPCGGPRVRAI